MSTQHPDNVRNPFFAANAVLEGDDEIKEAFYAYSHIKCQEQLWDCEGKEVDDYVVKKLLSKYEPFFKRNKLGEDIRLTLRVPNPEIEKDEAKILLETLESIPRSFDIAKAFYCEDVAPIFEVALPMTMSAGALLRIKEYYTRFVVGKADHSLGGMKIAEWVGDFRPKSINVIPLLETVDSMLAADSIVGEYVSKARVEGQQRVWLARSDTALNYGLVPAILINILSLQKLETLEEQLSAELLPIIGLGSAPFRGNLTPSNLSCIGEFPSVQTFTIQSAFKYDYDERDVADAVKQMNSSKRHTARHIDEQEARAVIATASDAYRKQVAALAETISAVAKHIPQRRRRKLHIGLFGYSREQGGIRLPRAITFCASLYSLGLPPEILGMDTLSPKDMDFIRAAYTSFDRDMQDALRYVNEDNFHFFPQDVIKAVKKSLGMFEYDVDEKHKKVTGIILDDFRRKDFAVMEENIMRAGALRGFLG
ncbi:MAG: phosphoenolpyruvate carboxylase [Candidatus Aenigmarchaeota archaeon]|nr:phosphoenolpyruvate carboxylase [Candidatus Aenigmarchaeota archaeon]